MMNNRHQHMFSIDTQDCDGTIFRISSQPACARQYLAKLIGCQLRLGRESLNEPLEGMS